MKKRPALLCIFSLLFLLTNLFPTAHASTIHSELRELYATGDYPAFARLLEKRIDEIESSTATGSVKTNDDEAYKLHMMLAHVCEWQLGRFNDGLAEYERALELRREQEALQKIGPNIQSPALEYLFVAGMYEHIKDHARALEYYQKILQEAKAYSDAVANSGERIFLGNDLIYLIQCAIDTNQLKLQSAKTYTPLAKKIDLMHESNPMMLCLMLANLFPEHNFSNAHNSLESFIKTNPATTYSMLLEYSILLVGAADITNASTQKAAKAYIKKHPESYCSLTLRFLLAMYYQSNSDEEKAKAYRAELKKIARKKNIELIIEPDEKFATPESTWESLRQAMAAGDIEAALSCHIPGDSNQRQLYTALGPEVLKKVAAESKPIEKIRADEQTAKYRVNRLHKDIDTEITYYIYFVNINGEWKIESM